MKKGSNNKSLEERIREAVREEIDIVPYDPQWPKLFEEEAVFLRTNLPKSIIRRIEHFGSTSIPGLAAKSIVDMLIEVSSLNETKKIIVPALESESYEYFWRTDNQPPYTWFIKRNSEGKRTHHLHMVESDSKLWERLRFRDYLREFPAVAKQYEMLKLTLWQEYPNDREKYTDGKTAFIGDVTSKAMIYYDSAEPGI